MFDWRRVGSWCGLAGPTIFLMMWIAAIASTPGYRVFEQWVSDLGVGEGAAFFNSGVILAGILNLPFAASLLLVLRPSRLGILGTIVLAVAGVFLVGIGVFTEDAGHAHWVVSISFFLSVLLALAMLALPLHTSTAMRPWAGMFTAVILSIGLAMTVVFAAGPLTETVVVMLVALWALTIAWMLRWHLCVVLRRPAGRPEA